MSHWLKDTVGESVRNQDLHHAQLSFQAAFHGIWAKGPVHLENREEAARNGASAGGRSLVPQTVETVAFAHSRRRNGVASLGRLLEGFRGWMTFAPAWFGIGSFVRGIAGGGLCPVEDPHFPVLGTGRRMARGVVRRIGRWAARRELFWPITHRALAARRKAGERGGRGGCYFWGEAFFFRPGGPCLTAPSFTAAPSAEGTGGTPTGTGVSWSSSAS